MKMNLLDDGLVLWREMFENSYAHRKSEIFSDAIGMQAT